MRRWTSWIPAVPLTIPLSVVLTLFGVAACSHTTDVSATPSAADLPQPLLPTASYAYADAEVSLPPHFVGPNGPGGGVLATDNTPSANRTTDAGATLGRVLFYDVRLSANDKESCSSCHQQAFAFGDTARLSRGFKGGFTHRHAMALANARFYQRGRFFWDERAATLEAQVLMPIQDTTEMGMTLTNLVTKLGATQYYPALFQAAFGTPQVTSDRIANALAQFVRSLSSYQSKFDLAFVAPGPNGPNFAGTLSPDEQLGEQLFTGPARCAQCHSTNAQVSDDIHNTGLDAVSSDTGAGGARFKAPSLRNIAVRAPYMHDGRFTTLAQVVEHYDTGIQPNANLDRRLRAPNGAPQRLNLTQQQRDALVAYLQTLTDQSLITAPKFSNPFPAR
jgi:cytochrome c peroxidase